MVQPNSDKSGSNTTPISPSEFEDHAKQLFASGDMDKLRALTEDWLAEQVDIHQKGLEEVELKLKKFREMHEQIAKLYESKSEALQKLQGAIAGKASADPRYQAIGNGMCENLQRELLKLEDFKRKVEDIIVKLEQKKNKDKAFKKNVANLQSHVTKMLLFQELSSCLLPPLPPMTDS